MKHIHIGLPPVILNYRDKVGNPGDTASPTTFAGMAIGPANSERYVIACVTSLRNVGINITAVSIGGVVATKLHSVGGAASQSISSIWIAKVPTGTTANVVVTHSVTGTLSCTTYEALNLLDPYTTVATGGVNATPLQATLATKAGGCILGSTMWTSAQTQTWGGTSGAVETVDDPFVSGGWRFGGGVARDLAEGSFSIVCTPSAAPSLPVLAAVSLR